jgi:putative transposase
MVRSVKITTKRANTNKKSLLEDFLMDYSDLCMAIIVDIFENGYTNQNKSKFSIKRKKYNLESNLNNEYLKQFDNGLFTQRMIQACGTQASAILRSCTEKPKKRKYMLRQLMRKKGDYKKLQKVVDRTTISNPKFELIEPQLDKRFYDIKEEKTNEFDGFIQLRIYKKKTIKIPFKKQKKMLQFESEGTRKNSIRIGKDYISLSYELPDKEKKKEGKTVGADQGIITTLSMSDGQVTIKNKDGYDLRSIIDVLNRRTKGSKGYQQAQDHRENYINWSINQLNFNGVRQVNLERLFQVGKGKKKGQFLSRFTYTLIKEKLESLAETEGFAIMEVDNMFRSQRCSNCGYTQKSNRRGKLFSCKHCDLTTDADFNASLNLEDDSLPTVPKWVREKRLNLKGFYWNHDGIKDSSGEFIVPQVI